MTSKPKAPRLRPAVYQAASSSSSLRMSVVGEEIRGRLEGQVRLASGAYALLDLGPAFTLVPWRPALEPYLGREIFGLVDERGELNWRLGRERGLGR